MVKLVMSYNIKDGRDADYYEFQVRKFAPGMTRLGLQPTDAWLTVYGESAQIVTGGIAEDLRSMRRILASREWENLRNSLQEFVTNYEEKIVPHNGKPQFF
ncbi:MAG: hypothetical protein GYB68_09775 [Chloroflexi bacterium]|nr:hypothetical protein [Chloroflexota bacterium]